MCACAADGPSGVEQFDASQAQGTARLILFLLDLMLPGLAGLDVCRHLAPL